MGLRRQHGLDCRFLHRIPQIPDPRIGVPPPLYNIRKFFLWQPHVQSPHRDQCIGAPLIPKGKGRHFPFLPQAVFRISFYNLLDRHMEHLGCSCFIDLPVRSEHFIYPLFPCQPCDHPCFDCWKVCDHKLPSLRWDERCPDQLGKCIRHISIDQPDTRIILRFYQISCFVQCF